MARNRQKEPAARTEEERERARVERERHRAARGDGQSPVPPPPVQPPPADAVAAEPAPVEPPESEPASVEPPTVESLVVEPVTAEPPAVAPSTPPPAAATQPTPDPVMPDPVMPDPVALAERAPLAGARARPRTTRRLAAVAALVGVVAVVWFVIDHLSNKRHAPTVPAPAVAHVLIPEGYTRHEIAARAHAAGLTGSYLKASEHSSLLDPSHYGAPHGTADLEGFLFPATYDVYRGSPAGRLVDEQLVAFRERFGDEYVRRAHELHVTPYQLLTVASIVEREAELSGDRPKVAAVIYNRLKAGMLLGVDATIRYALGDFSQPLTAAQLATHSRYNTRLHHGLPPTPISNPGLASLKAAAHPAHVSYLYYVSGADGCGEQLFSTSEAAFERNAAAYRKAVSRNGGRVPTCKKKA